MRLPLARLDRFAPSLLLLRVHVAMDQPLAILGQRLGGRILSPPPRSHSKKTMRGASPNANPPRRIRQDLRTGSTTASNERPHRFTRRRCREPPRAAPARSKPFQTLTALPPRRRPPRPRRARVRFPTTGSEHWAARDRRCPPGDPLLGEALGASRSAVESVAFVRDFPLRATVSGVAKP
jgi:hypothetical protein